ncbi:MAG TPA: anthranilate synthase component I [Caulifigura sp.]|jgi:anthranilate synthase component 1|nr:anthranilate synthase component I [Caulifigura sp.]
MHRPDFAAWSQLAPQATQIPVYREILGDTLTPVSAYCRAGWKSQTFLFESVVGGERVGRYSFLGGDPFIRIEAFGEEVHLTRDGKTETTRHKDPLELLQQLVDEHRSIHLPGLPRFCGGAVGYAGYDVVRYVERLPNPPKDDRQLPDLSFALYDSMIVFDHIRKTVLVVSHASTNGDLKANYEAACRRVDELVQRLQTAPDGLEPHDISPQGQPQLKWKSNFTQPEFEQVVEKSKEYIRAGDIFQVVCSQRLELETKASALEIYRALRVVNPSPFMFLLDTPHCQLIGASPEIMVRVEEGEVTIRPLAGTRPRGKDDAEDKALADELLADPKEIAEHVMLVDLARNDVGRVAQYGSVKLSDVMVVERYSHVMHITSDVTGQLKPGLRALDALRAGLPAGTVSGAPKVRAMEIIDELERTRRGPYAGAVGYLDYTGNMDTCIALRTLVLIGNKAYVQAGAGLVADSVPAMEYQETLNKAKGLLRAIETAEQQITKR